MLYLSARNRRCIINDLSKEWRYIYKHTADAIWNLIHSWTYIKSLARNMTKPLESSPKNTKTQLKKPHPPIFGQHTRFCVYFSRLTGYKNVVLLESFLYPAVVLMKYLADELASQWILVQTISHSAISKRGMINDFMSENKCGRASSLYKILLEVKRFRPKNRPISCKHRCQVDR